MELPFFTIGHSNRSLEDFIALLREAQVECIVDVRHFPRSRSNPQFNIDTLPGGLATYSIDYEHLPALGGRRGRDLTVPREINAFWKHASFHNYADYAFSVQFQAGFGELLEMGHQKRCAIMCSEAVWWRCHRRIITDYLFAARKAVYHVMGINRREVARLTGGAVIEGTGRIAYPAVHET